MRFRQLDLNLLVAFDHMLNLRSISRAAEKMNMSQSAMSNALTRLRDYFDDPLLVQVGRRMELTPKAESMRHSVRDILVRIESTISSDAEFDPARSNRRFRILLSDYTMTVLMPRALALASQEGPNLQFELLPQTGSPDLVIERGEADVVLAPRMFLSPDLPSELLFEDGFACVAWSGGRFGARAPSEAEFVEARHVRMVPPTSSTSFENEFIRARGIERRTDIECYSFAALPALIVGSDRLATVHGLLAKTLARALPVTLHPLPFEISTLDEHMQWHPYKSQDPGLRWLRELLRRAAQIMQRELAA
ncbi:MAG: LysR family transcriptional regulator [Mesorhizobium sp.]|nr:LysR family transcriptional regulator [Mesorhizobium sp.]MCO5163782.1 LysR family transcriptional regulator [Mesorhizobium sp.]